MFVVLKGLDLPLALHKFTNKKMSGGVGRKAPPVLTIINYQ